MAVEGLWKYFAVLGALFASGMGFPVPEEAPVIAGGMLAAHASTQVPREHPYWFILWPICIIGVVVSDGILYCIGRFGGRRLLHLPWVERRLVHPEKREKIEDNFHKYGIKILLGARFAPGIRAPIFVMAGVLRMPWIKFLIADGIYAVPGVSALFFLSFWFTDSFKDVFEKMHHKVEGLVSLFVLVGTAVTGGYLAYAYLRRRVVTGDPKDVPLLSSVVKPAAEDQLPHAAASSRLALTIPRMIVDAIIAQARTELPNECCGLLAGNSHGQVIRWFPLVNSAASPTRFLSSDESIIQANRNIRDLGLEVLAVYHSHPNSDATPSRSDLEQSYAPHATVIISLASEPPQVKAWYLDTDPPTPCTFTITHS